MQLPDACRVLLATLTLFANRAFSEEVVYVTDLSIYTYLAPCAASAVSRNIALQTYSSVCPEGVTDLQSCVCTDNFAAVSSGVSVSVSSTCGATATDDQASAQSVLSAYCNQGSSAAFPTPADPVSSYIYELPGFDDLAPCASSALSNVVQYNTYYYCPPDPTALAPCACEKNQNSLRISESINREVASVCSTNSADMSSAQAFFSAYCELNSGTTSYPTTSNPPGSMTYYITDLPQYSSLASCAQRGIFQAVTFQTWDICRDGGPEAIASCACVKTGVSRIVSSSMSSNVRFFCSTDVMDNMSSASEVLNFYCSAARAEVTATGIVVSASQTSAVVETRPSGPSATSTSSTGSSGGGTSSGTSKGVIAGATVGAVVGVLAGGLVVFCLMRRRTRNRAARAEDAPEAADRASAPVAGGTLAKPAGGVDAVHQSPSQSHTPVDDDSISPAAPPPYEPGTYGDMYKGKKNP